MQLSLHLSDEDSKLAASPGNIGISCIPKSIIKFAHSKSMTSQWTKQSMALTLASDGTWMKIMNTAIGLFALLQFHRETGSGERFGTHTLENFIGLIRYLCSGDDRGGNIWRVVARTILAQNFMNQLSVPVKNCQRENCGGVSFAFSLGDAAGPFDGAFLSQSYCITLD
jgi:hypothetical protein